jgi:hypothetical protein
MPDGLWFHRMVPRARERTGAGEPVSTGSAAPLKQWSAADVPPRGRFGH